MNGRKIDFEIFKSGTKVVYHFTSGVALSSTGITFVSRSTVYVIVTGH